MMTLEPKFIGGKISAPPSKSEAHRALICAALSDAKTYVKCGSVCDDVKATADALCALGAKIIYEDGVFTVFPIENAAEHGAVDCAASGSTLRFVLPVAAAFGTKCEFLLDDSLKKRPSAELYNVLLQGGAHIEAGDSVLLTGKFEGGNYEVSGDISSQYASGLMFALSVCGGSVKISGGAQSRPYIEMTARVLEKFGADITFENGIYRIAGWRLVSPGEYTVGGDFSGAAAFICMGAFADEKITVSGLDTLSLSGDGAIINILRDMGAKIEITDGDVICYPSKLHGAVIDVRDCPDLAPILAATALGAEGKTKIIGAKRLKFKETDRLSSVAATLLTLGGKITVSDDGFEIEKSEITGGEVDCGADHRLAMCAAVAAVIGRKKTEIRGAESVAKSYPDFWLDFGRISK